MACGSWLWLPSFSVHRDNTFSQAFGTVRGSPDVPMCHNPHFLCLPINSSSTAPHLFIYSMAADLIWLQSPKESQGSHDSCKQHCALRWVEDLSTEWVLVLVVSRFRLWTLSNSKILSVVPDRVTLGENVHDGTIAGKGNENRLQYDLGA